MGARAGMSGHPVTTAWTGARSDPLIVAVISVPLLRESLAEALEGIALLRRVPSEIADLAGLVRHINPSVLVSDSSHDITELASIGEELSIPVVHICLETHQLRVLRDRRWTVFPSTEMRPHEIRNVVMGAIYGAPVVTGPRSPGGLRSD
jgi:hypothetical protein